MSEISTAIPFGAAVEIAAERRPFALLTLPSSASGNWMDNSIGGVAQLTVAGDVVHALFAHHGFIGPRQHFAVTWNRAKPQSPTAIRMELPPSTKTLSIEEKLAAIWSDVPDEEWKRLPTDLSLRVDDYLYGDEEQ